MTKMTGAQAIIKCLQEEGVNIIFGFPGGAVIDLYDALLNSDIKQSWSGTSRAPSMPPTATPGSPARSGSPCSPPARVRPTVSPPLPRPIWIPSPWSSSPARCRRALIGNDAFQEVDIVGITRPCTKHNYLVSNQGRSGPDHCARPFTSARTGRPGPVLVDLPKDVCRPELNYPEKKPITHAELPADL